MGEQPPSDNVYVTDLPADIDDNMVRTLFNLYATVANCKAMEGKYQGQKGAALVRFQSVEEATWVVENLSGKTLEGLDAPVRIRFASKRQPGESSAPKGREPGGGTYTKSAPARWNGNNGAGAAAAGPYDPPGPGAEGRQQGRQQKKTVSTTGISTLIDGLKHEGLLPGAGRKPDENCLYITGLPYNTTNLDLYKIFAAFGPIPTTGVKASLLPDGTCSGVGFVDYNDPESAKLALETLNGTGLPDGVFLTITKKWSGKRSSRPKYVPPQVADVPEVAEGFA